MIKIKITNNKNANLATKLFDSKKSLIPFVLYQLFVTPISFGVNSLLELLSKKLD
jgi:hypothetical protein